jgi:NAD-dependent deacetylase
MTSEDQRKKHWEMKTGFFDILMKAEPNPAHKIFGYLHEQGTLLGVVTQNIDRLHDLGGVPNEKITRLHGSEYLTQCALCKKSYDRFEIHDRIKGGEGDPRCSECGGIIRPLTVFFGEPLQPTVLEQAKNIMNQCDLLFVVRSILKEPSTILR